ncbi:hypothetical protein [Candidatus Leptofilum sp.]|uniref:hypothetical protein n=1 Tax=Candidatus Leptofilum sp. TaxID=3241576 RepID=UPI003B5C2B8F
MTKKAKYLFLVMAAIIMVGCGSNSPTPTTRSNSASASQAVACAFSIPIAEVDAPVPGEKVYLVPEIEENTMGWTFSWQSEPDVLLDDESVSTSLIVPNDTSKIEVELEAINAEGCVGTGSVSITVDLPTVAATKDDPELTPTLMPTEESTPEPTAVSTDTPSPEPTQAPTSTETATKEPSPTPLPEPTATATPIPAPIITYLEFLPGGAVVVHWNWNEQLAPTQFFAVRFWSENDPRPEARFSITWTKDFQHEFSVSNVDYPIGTYLINVAVMEGPSNGVHTEIIRSQDKPLFVDAPDPTTTPPPLP